MLSFCTTVSGRDTSAKVDFGVNFVELVNILLTLSVVVTV